MLSSKKSIFFHSFKVIIFILILDFAGVILLSNIILGNFFSSNQTVVFGEIYKQIDKIEDIELRSEGFKEILNLCRYNNCTIEVYDTDTNKRLYSPYVYETDVFSTIDSKQVFDSILGPNNKAVIIDDLSEHRDTINALNGLNNVYSLLIQKSDNIYILVQTSTESVSMYKEIMYKAVFLCFIVSIVAASVPSYCFSKDISKNISELINISRKISNDDFTEKYGGSSYVEFDELGNCVNKMADSIKAHIDDITNDLERRKKEEKTQKEFISNVSHELKTPLSIVSGYAEGIKYLPDNKKEDYCDVIIKECGRMRDIVKNLLDLSYLDNKCYEMEEFAVCDLLGAVIDKFRIKNPERVFVSKICSNSIATFDYDSIENVIINYLDNAIKYSTGDIEIRCYDESEFIYVGVCSNGILTKEDSERIWDRFYRADKSHKRNSNSTGLGLSIVKATMDKHGMPYGVNIDDGVEFFVKLRKV